MIENVSVVITSYNIINYIGQAIESVQAQDYKGEIEIIVVDDGSTDGSIEYLKRLNKIHLVIHNKNSGVMQATLSGIQATTNDIVFFLDGDDIWSSNKITSCMELFKENVGFVTHDLWRMSPNGAAHQTRSRVNAVLGNLSSEHISEFIRNGILTHCDYIWLGSAFGIRKSLIEFDRFVALCQSVDYLQFCYQDWPLAVWASLKNDIQFCYVDKQLFGYRIHENNYSGSSQTLYKLQRNLNKSYHTAKFINHILFNHPPKKVVIKKYRALESFYTSQLASAQVSYLETLSFIWRNSRNLYPGIAKPKAFTRLFLSLILGPTLAYKLLTYIKTRFFHNTHGFH